MFSSYCKELEFTDKVPMQDHGFDSATLCSVAASCG